MSDRVQAYRCALRLLEQTLARAVVEDFPCGARVQWQDPTRGFCTGEISGYLGNGRTTSGLIVHTAEHGTLEVPLEYRPIAIRH